MIKKKYPANKPELKKKIELWFSQVAAIYSLRFLRSVFLCLREDLKGKSGQLKDFSLPVSPLHFLFFSFSLNGPGRTVTCSLYIYTSQYLKEIFSVRCILFSLTTEIGKQTITFFAINNYNPISRHYKYIKRYYRNLQHFLFKTKRQTRARKDDESVRFQTANKTDAFPVVASLPPKNRIEYSPSDSSRPRALKCHGFRRELPNTLWNVNFTTITRFPATLNADFFMKQLLLKLCMSDSFISI